MNLFRYFEEVVRENPDDIAIVRDSEENLTYGELMSKIKKISSFISKETSENSTIAIYMQDRPEYIVSTMAILHSGRVAVPINTLLSSEEVYDILVETSPELLLTSDVLSTVSNSLSNKVESLKSSIELTEGSKFKESLFNEYEENNVCVDQVDDEKALIIYTSGTTGSPKGVVLTHRNLSSMIECGKMYSNLTREDMAIVSVPLFHVSGLNIGCLTPLLAGSSIIIQEYWSAEKWFKLVSKYDVNFAGLVSSMMYDIVNFENKENYNIKNLEFCLYGGSPIQDKIIEEFENETEAHTANIYGLTESSGYCLAHSREEIEEGNVDKKSIGTPIHCVKTKIVNSDENEVVNGKRGELLIKGDSVFKGYLKDGKLDKEVFEEGWFRTGDIVIKREKGYKYIDRKDNIIITGGEKVSPIYVEEVLLENDSIKDACVFSTDDERYGEKVNAAVIIEDETSLKVEEIEEFIENNKKLTTYKKPKTIHIVDRIPKTTSMKKDRKSLKEKFN